MTAEYTVKLPTFEGPLDLLLHLIKVNELEITEISISEITSQYLETLRLMETLDLEVAGDFLVMAATLLNIKLRSILPEPEEEIEEGEQEEAGDDYLSARALMQRLIEYRKFKEAALALGGMAERQSLIFVREVALPKLTEAQADPAVRGDLGLLLEAFSRVIKFVQRRDYHQVQNEEYNVDDKIAMVRRRVLLDSRIDVGELFAQCQVKIEMIVTLIALLELCRLKELRLSQVDSYGNIIAFPRREGEEAPVGDTEQEAEELKRLEADILASRTGLVDNSAPPEDEEDELLEQVLSSVQAPKAAQAEAESGPQTVAAPAEEGAGAAVEEGLDEIPEETPETSPERVPDELPDAAPGEIPAEAPEAEPETVPQEIPELTPEETTEASPETIPEAFPGEEPEAPAEDLGWEEAGVIEMEPPEGGGEILADEDEEFIGPAADGTDGSEDAGLPGEDDGAAGGGARIIDITPGSEPGEPEPDPGPGAPAESGEDEEERP